MDVGYRDVGCGDELEEDGVGVAWHFGKNVLPE